MATDIEWAEETWNPITGCTKISEGCRGCYASRMAKRLAGRYGYLDAPHQFDVTYHRDKLAQLSRWKKPRRIFAVSMGDILHDDVDQWWIDDILDACIATPQHDYLFLTKRPNNFNKKFGGISSQQLDFLKEKTWWGVTVEKQKYDWRIEELYNIPALLYFVSIEPMLGAIDLNGTSLGQILGPCDECGKTEQNPHCEACMGISSLSWVICGGESGPGARPMHPDWVRSLRDQCIEAAVPFMFKQWGEYMGLYSYPPSSNLLKDNGGFLDWGKEIKPWGECNGQPWVWKTGKKKSGRLLDGKIWDQYPACSGQVESKP